MSGFPWVYPLQIKFKSFGSIRRLIGTSETTLDVPISSTISDVIETIVQKWGSQAEELLMDEGQFSGNLIIMLNMKDISTLDGMNTPVNQDDEVIILPHVQGG